MSGNHVRRIVWNTRERILSNDFNNAMALQSRALIEGLVALHGGESGVISGYGVSVIPATLTVAVAPGLALLGTADAQEDYESRYDWLEKSEGSIVDLSSFVDGANPRWVVIEIAAADAVESQSLRDIFNPALGTFAAQTVDKVRGSDPTVTARAGTPGLRPAFPAGTPGAIPLAYVYIPAGAAALTVGDEVMCRPLLHSTKGVSVTGGGISVPDANTEVTIHPMAAVGPSLPGGVMSMDAMDEIQISGGDPWVFGQAYPTLGTVDVLYLYAVNAPYPSGYDAWLAAREFAPGVNIGPGTRIPSLFGVSAGAVHNCLMVVSTTAPSAPYDHVGDALAGQPLVDTIWGDGTVDSSVYLGSVTVGAAGSLLRQDYWAAGEVCGLGNLAFTSETDVRNGSDSGFLSGNWTLENPLSGTGAEVVPSTAASARVQIHRLAAGLPCRRQWLFQGTLALTVSANELSIQPPDSAADAHWFYLDETGAPEFTWQHEEIAGSEDSTLTFAVVGYKDAVLARR